ncbi:MAG: hypothetical protein RLZZ267_749 [Bacillota bacterium]|jgi:zinc transport system ATP-binding protein
MEVIQTCHDPIINIDHVSFAYQNKQVLTDFNFCVQQRDFVGLVGSNGAGKTTLLKMIVGLHKPTQGQIRLFGQPLEQFKDWHRIGYVPQKSSLNPLFPATVYEVVKSGLYVRKTMFTRMTKEMLQKVEDAMQALGIENLRDSLIGRLSGGQQQRVFLARALVNNPDLLILDEPTIGIDQKTQESFFQLIFHMHQHHNITFLLVSHDLQMVHNYMGQEPKKQTDRLQLYVRHSHDLQDCRETDLTHTLRHFTNGGL